MERGSGCSSGEDDGGTGTREPNLSKATHDERTIDQDWAPQDSEGERPGDARIRTKKSRMGVVWLVYLWADVEAERLEIRDLSLFHRLRNEGSERGLGLL